MVIASEQAIFQMMILIIDVFRILKNKY